MANDSFDINIKGFGAGGAGPNIDFTAFQDSLTKLTQSIKDASLAAADHAKNMVLADKRISELFKSGKMGPKERPNTKKEIQSAKQESKTSDSLFLTGIDKLIGTIDKLNTSLSNIKTSSGNKPSLTEEEKKLQQAEKERLAVEKIALKEQKKLEKDKQGSEKLFQQQQHREDLNTKNRAEKELKEKPDDPNKLANEVKKILAIVGVGAIVKSFVESTIITPAKNTGYLIGSNVLTNPVETGSTLIENFQKSQASTTTGIATLAGGLLGSPFGFVGAGIGASTANLIANTFTQSQIAEEIPFQQRALQVDFYRNIGQQQPRFGATLNSLYGDKNSPFDPTTALTDPYFIPKAAFSQEFSRYSQTPLDKNTTEGIVNSLSTSGFGSPGELTTIGKNLAQISKFTNEGAKNTGEIFKTLISNNQNPIEASERLLGLLNSGMSLPRVENILGQTANATDAFKQGQVSYFEGSAASRFQAQLLSQITGANPEKIFAGGVEGRAAGKIALKNFRESDEELRRGIYGQASIKADIQRKSGIFPGQLDKTGEFIRSKEFMDLSSTQKIVLKSQKGALEDAKKGRSFEDVLTDAAKSIENATSKFGALNAAMAPVIDSFNKMGLQGANHGAAIQDRILKDKTHSQKTGGR